MRISIFDNQHEAVKELPQERQGAFWVAFFAYVFDGVEPSFSEPMERMAWSLVRTYVDKSKTAVQNGEKGGRKPSTKTKVKNQGKKPSTETKDGNQPLLENENEREGLGESLKDSLTPSPRETRRAWECPATPRATMSQAEVKDAFDAADKAERDMMAARSQAEQWEAEAVPCPSDVSERWGVA